MAAEAAIGVRPMTVGAEVLGFERALEESEDGASIRAAIHAAWLDHGLLLFRGVHSIDGHLALSRCLGELEIHPIEHVRAKESPYFMSVGDEVSRPYVYDGDIKVGTVPWHRDTAYTVGIAKGAVLRILETPPMGGETLFCDTALAYDELSQSLKQRVEPLEYRASFKSTPMEQSGPGALWHTVRALTPDEIARAGVDVPDTSGIRSTPFPPVIHRAVVTHPESGRRCLFLSPKEFDYFLGMDRGETDELFARLVDHLLRDRYVYEHRWRVDDAMAWDNRRFMHAAAGNRLGLHRRGLRTTLAGEDVVGRLFEEPIDA